MANLLVTTLAQVIRLAIPPPESDQAMTSISSNSAAMSPADRLQYALQAAVQAGTVNASDQTALSSALTNIDSSLQSTAATSNTTNLDPGSIKDQVNSLINDQVSNGTLTSDQGSELQQVFAQAAHKMGGGHHHHMHVGGGSSSDSSNSDGSSSDQSNPIDSLFADLTSSIDSLFGTTSTTGTSTTDPTATAAATSTSVSGASSTTATSASTSASSSADTLTASIDQMIGFLKQIEQKAVSGYTASGATTGTVANDSLLVNATA